jgi:hypothetical protein
MSDRKPLTGMPEAERIEALRKQGLDEHMDPLNATPEEKKANDIINTPPAAPEIKSGWKTTEFWLVTVLLGVLAYALESLVTMLPTLLATPGLPVWAAPLDGVLTLVLGLLAKAVVGSYQKHRTELKLPADPKFKS